MRSRYLAASFVFTLFFLFAAPFSGSQAAPATKPETVEWVYRIQYGHRDEWLQIFKKYQIAILQKQKQLGYVKDYTVWAPSLHTSEESRWDIRVIITRASHDAPAGQSEDEIAQQLFPDQTTFHRDENRRWELTTNHWDLPIHQVNLSADVSGITPAPAVIPDFRKLRRFSTRHPEFNFRKVYQQYYCSKQQTRVDVRVLADLLIETA